MLDTNIVSDLVRHPHGHVASRIGEVGVSNICTSIVVAAELRYGAAKSNSDRLRERVALILGALDVEPIQAPFDSVYGEIRSVLEKRGRPIGGNDLMIAAHALSLDCAIVMANTREFGRVQGLRIENWL
jgi:tRNA(fMet)-specific endonuclease VapC